jgi:hypothetical protein
MELGSFPIRSEQSGAGCSTTGCSSVTGERRRSILSTIDELSALVGRYFRDIVDVKDYIYKIRSRKTAPPPWRLKDMPKKSNKCRWCQYWERLYLQDWRRKGFCYFGSYHGPETVACKAFKNRSGCLWPTRCQYFPIPLANVDYGILNRINPGNVR